MILVLVSILVLVLVTSMYFSTNISISVRIRYKSPMSLRSSLYVLLAARPLQLGSLDSVLVGLKESAVCVPVSSWLTVYVLASRTTASTMKSSKLQKPRS